MADVFQHPNARIVLTIAALNALDTTGLSSDDAVYVLGYYAEGDEGGGLFRWSPAAAAADDGGMVIRPTVGAAATGNGRWLRVYESKTANVLHFGAKNDNTGDQQAAVDAASLWVTQGFTGAAINTTMAGTVYFPPGTYRFTTAPLARAYVKFVGASMDATTLHWASTGIFLDANANTAGIGIRFALADICLFGSSSTFELFRLRSVFSCKNTRVSFKGTHGPPASGKAGQQLGQTGVFLHTDGTGDNTFESCRFYDLGVGVLAGDIGNQITDCHFAYCYYAVSGDLAAGNPSTDMVNCTLNADTTPSPIYSQCAVYFPRTANRIHLVECYIEGWPTCVQLGNPANTADGGPYGAGFINCKIGPGSGGTGLLIAAAKQTTIINCIFAAAAGDPSPITFPAGHAAPEGICIQPVFSYAWSGLEGTDMPSSHFPSRWVYLGRIQNKLSDDGVYIDGYPNGVKVVSGTVSSPEGSKTAPRGSLYLSSAGTMYLKATGATSKPWDNTGWVQK